MVILGVGDGLDAGAALVVDDRPVAVEAQERLDRVPRSRAFPWGAVDAVLQESGLRERDVDLIAVAGRFALRGCPALVALPLASGTEPVAAVPADALRVHREARLDAMVMRPWVVRALD